MVFVEKFLVFVALSMGLVGKKDKKPFIELKKCRKLDNNNESARNSNTERDYWFGGSSVIGTMVVEDLKTGEIR